MKEKIIRIIGIIIIAVIAWAFIVEPKRLVIHHIKIENEALKSVKVVVAGDFHLKTFQENRLKRIVKNINKQDADIVLFIGDYVNGHEQKRSLSQDKLTNNLKNVHSKYGVYSILGNHDWWMNGIAVEKSLEKANIQVLKNENRKIKIGEKTVTIAGVEDLITREPDVLKALKGAEKPIIFMTHTPDLFPQVPKEVDLTLAGHTHGGQIRIPFFGSPIVPSHYGKKYAQGLIEEDGKKMIVTRGIGNSILSVRFNCPPEILVIEFE